MATPAPNSIAIRVVHCLRAPLGGLFRHVCDLAAGQIEHGLRVGLICDASTGDAEAERRLAKLAPGCALGITRLPMARAPHWSDLRVVREVKRLCENGKPDIVHGHGAKGGAYARLATRVLPAKSVYTLHGGSLHYRASSPVGAAYLSMERFLRRYTDGLIFECEFSAETYKRKIGTLPCPERTVHNGLLAHELDPIPCAETRSDFLFVGELRQLKGLDVLIDAMRLVVNRHPGASLCIAGSGPGAARFEARARALELQNCITFVPAVYPAASAFAAADCVVVPSLAEAFPYIVLEAAGAGRPVLATAVGGIGEIFGPFRDWLIPPGNAGLLADAMSAVLADRSGAQERARLLHARVQATFRQENMVRDITGFYAQLLGDGAVQ